MKTLIYKLTFPSGRVYIGITKNLQKRMTAHISASATHKLDNKVNRAIRKYGMPTPEILKTELSAKLAAQYEKYFIKVYNSYKDGYNSTLGGEGVIGVTPWNKGRSQERTTKLKCVKSRGCKLFRAIELETGKEVWKGLFQTECIKALKLKQTDRGNLCSCLKGTKKTLKGYYFEYLQAPKDIADIQSQENSENSIARQILTKGYGPFKVIDCETDNTVWSGIRQTRCAEALGINRRYIGHCLAGKRKTYKGYRFEYI